MPVGFLLIFNSVKPPLLYFFNAGMRSAVVPPEVLDPGTGSVAGSTCPPSSVVFLESKETAHNPLNCRRTSRNPGEAAWREQPHSSYGQIRAP